METLIRFQANKCDPQLTTDMMVETMESACGLGSRISCVWLSSKLFQTGDEEKRKRALEIAAQVCRQGEAEGCANVARMLAWWNGAGKPTPESLSDVLDWGHEGCRLGGLSSCNDYAKGLLQRKQSSDVGDAQKLLEDQCSKKFEPSCVRLGREERLGTFGPPNRERAASLWRRACACGDMDGCLGVAIVYFEQNDAGAALAISKHACETVGYYEACSGLGKIYMQGKLVARDTKQARKYFERACHRNDGASCEALKTIDHE
jgi:TPR repeat protein